MRLLLIGAPGAGKGTQAVRLAEHFGITHISSGDLLRKHVEDETPFGVQIKEFVSRGDLVPDQMVLDMLRKPIVEASARGGYVLDGFPRTVEQAEIAYETAKALGVAVQVAAYLEVGRDELVRRLLARGRGSDDTQDVIEHRLEVYNQKTDADDRLLRQARAAGHRQRRPAGRRGVLVTGRPAAEAPAVAAEAPGLTCR